MSSPLFDTLFRPTTAAGPAAAAVASAAPVRARGGHTRAGNAMSRTRTALLAGAARAVEVSGTKITMAQVAASSGVAKATLYNHFRDRQAVLSALVVDQVVQIVDAQADKPLADALADAALAIATHPVRRGLAHLEPAVLARLGTIDTSAEGWLRAHTAVDDALLAARVGGTDTVLRWLASYVLSPAGPSAIAADVATILGGLPEAPAQARPA